MKKWIAAIWLTLLTAVILGFFWYNQLVYSLPTPVPRGYHQISIGQQLTLNHKLNFRNGKPLFLHFFNPDCPCSRFNIDHIRSLIKSHKNEVNFAVILMTNKDYTAREIRKKFGLDVPLISDTSIAKQCGVYSTPQAVIITSDHHLYYRGNYNKNRYCTDQQTSYAKIALDDLLNNKSRSQSDVLAIKAYGCSLPDCTSK